jgi:ribosomal protein S18 acetylase RimI-like enzyme
MKGWQVKKSVNSNYIVRQATSLDLSALEWEGELIHYRRLYADTYHLAEQGRTLIWVADLIGVGVIGQLFVSLSGNRPELSDGVSRAYVYGFRVRPNYRNQGIGTKMMNAVESDLNQRGFCEVTLNVARTNLDAQRFYERLGYRVVAADPGDWCYLDNEGRRCDVHEPAWRMVKDL